MITTLNSFLRLLLSTNAGRVTLGLLAALLVIALWQYWRHRRRKQAMKRISS